MRLATHQPSLFPWAGFWHKLANVDTLGLLVDVQFDASSNQHRCMLGNSWLTIPVAKEDRHALIHKVKLADGFLQKDLVPLIRGRMPKKQFPYVDRLGEVFTFLERWQYRSLHIVNESTSILVRDLLGLDVPFSLIPPWPYQGQTKNDRLWEHVGRIAPEPGTYVCGKGTASYIDPASTHGWSVDIQEEVDETLPDRFQSVLYFIGKYEDPLGAMLERFRLRPLLGGGDGTVCQAGHSSGRPEGGQ